MVQIVGKYKFVSSENFEEYLKAMGQSENAGPFVSSKPVVEVKHEGDQWVISVDSNGKVSSSTFTLGETYDETLPSFGSTLKSITRQEGDNKFITETQVGEVKSTRVYEFTDAGMTVHLSADKHNVKATRTYERV